MAVLVLAAVSTESRLLLLPLLNNVQAYVSYRSAGRFVCSPILLAAVDLCFKDLASDRLLTPSTKAELVQRCTLLT